VAYLSNVAVLPAARRQGIARKIVDAAEQLAASWDCTAIGGSHRWWARHRWIAGARVEDGDGLRVKYIDRSAHGGSLPAKHGPFWCPR